MPKYLGRSGPLAYSQRTDKKVRYRDMVEDGEIPGLGVERSEADAPHPQRKLRRIGADRMQVYRPSPEVLVQSVTVRIGMEASTEALGEGKIAIPILPVLAGPIEVA